MQSLPSWTSLQSAERQRWRRTRRGFAEAVNRYFNPFISIEPPPTGTADDAPGALAGLPYAVKDMFRTGSRVPTCGLLDGTACVIAGESDLLKRFDDAGADLVGFTNMTELACEPSGYNANHGRVINPWNTSFIPGGSSSGSAVAVAVGAVAVAVGSDTAGSLRIPAHACGITALKPTNGLVSMQGVMPLSPSLDTIGFLARDAADLGLAVDITLALPKVSPIGSAVVLSDALDQSEPDVRLACSNAIDAIRECGVAIATQRGLTALEAIDPHVLVILQAEAARQHRAVLNDARLSASLRKRLAKGAEISNIELADSLAARGQLQQDITERIFGEADIALLPVMPIRTPEAALCDPESDRFTPRVLYELSRFTRFANFLGLPVVAMPAGFDDHGMPVALQIVGRRGLDLALLDLTRAVQAKTDWHARMPAELARIRLHERV